MQMVKCNDTACCGQRRSSYNDVFSGRFLPAPVPLYNNDKGITYAPVGSSNGTFGSLFQHLALRHLEPSHEFVRMPFDLYRPSVTDDLIKRSCKQCGMYFPSQVAKRSHARIHKRALAMAVKEADVEEIEAEPEAEVVPVNATAAAVTDGVPVVRNLFDAANSRE